MIVPFLRGEKAQRKSFKKGCRGFTFVEMMMALVILSTGIISIYRAFFVSLDIINHISYRLEGLHLLNEKIAQIERDVAFDKQIPFGSKKDIDIKTINGKNVNFEYNLDLKSVENIERLAELTLTLKWTEHGRQVQINRTLYLML